MPASEPLGIGLLGFGTVGSAVHRLLVQHADNVERVAGRPVRVVRALVRDPSKPRDAADGLLTTDFADVRDDPRVRVVAELMGGVEPTRAYLLELLERGVSVVSANKQLLARHGEELFAAAERGGAQLRFEASVCAAIPVVKVLRESLVAADVREVLGIVNGTTNFVLTAMARDGQTYADALREGPGARLRRGRPDRGRRRRRRRGQARDPGLDRLPRPRRDRRRAVLGDRRHRGRRRRAGGRAGLRRQAAGPGAPRRQRDLHPGGTDAGAVRPRAGRRRGLHQRGRPARRRHPRDPAPGPGRRRRRDGERGARRPARHPGHHRHRLPAARRLLPLAAAASPRASRRPRCTSA